MKTIELLSYEKINWWKVGLLEKGIKVSSHYKTFSRNPLNDSAVHTVANVFYNSLFLWGFWYYVNVLHIFQKDIEYDFYGLFRILGPVLTRHVLLAQVFADVNFDLLLLCLVSREEDILQPYHRLYLLKTLLGSGKFVVTDTFYLLDYVSYSMDNWGLILLKWQESSVKNKRPHNFHTHRNGTQLGSKVWPAFHKQIIKFTLKSKVQRLQNHLRQTKQ